MAGDPGAGVAPRAVIYVRQSLDATGEAAGVARQQEACEQLCAARGWQVATVCADNSVSAYSGAPRPGWEEVLRLARARAVDVIVAWHVDRFTRSLPDLERLIDLAETLQLRVATVSGDLDLGSDSGRLVARILASVARAEGERKAARQKLANAQSAAAGRPAPGPRPIGYERDAGTYRIVEHEAAAVRRAAEAILAGSTLATVAEAWNAAGLRTSQGGRPWRGDSVRKALLSPRNVGQRTHKGVVVAEDAWPALLQHDTYAALVVRLTDPGRGRGPGPVGTLLAGLATCGVCGRTVNGGGHNTRHDLVYKCRHGSHFVHRRDPVDTYVTAAVLERLAMPDAARQLLAVDPSEDVAALHDQRAELRRRLDVLSESYTEGLVDVGQLHAGTARLRARLAKVDDRLVASGQVDVLTRVVGHDDVAAAWAALDLQQQRAVVDTLCKISLQPLGRGAKGWRPDALGLVWRRPLAAVDG